MWCEAYIVFSQGNIGSFQSTMWPTCFKAPYLNCNMDMVQVRLPSLVACPP